MTTPLDCTNCGRNLGVVHNGSIYMSNCECVCKEAEETICVGSPGVSTFTVTVDCHDCKSKHYIYPSGPGYQEYKCGCGKVVRVTA
jgi:hypothetical protein